MTFCGISGFVGFTCDCKPEERRLFLLRRRFAEACFGANRRRRRNKLRSHCNRKRFFWFLSEEIVHPFVRRESAFFLSEEGMHPFVRRDCASLCQKRVRILFVRRGYASLCQKRLCIPSSEESPHSFCLKRVCIPFCQKRLCISAFCSNDYSSEPVAEEAVVAVLAVGAEDDDLTAVVELRAEGHTLVIG